MLCNFSVTNGVVIIPYPEHDSLYYVFYQNRLIGNADDGESYSIVNMNLDGGLGAVTTKNTSLIHDVVTEKLTAVKHGNGRDWWLITHDANKRFIKFLISTMGISDSSSQRIGIIQDLIQGEICISPSGDKLGLVSSKSVEVYNFNRCTGHLSNRIQLDSTSDINSPGFYGCSFSPDKSKFYASRISSTAISELYQFDLSNPNPSATLTLIWQCPTTSYFLSQHKLAPNGRIYCAISKSGYPNSVYGIQNMNLSVINQPDSLGLACDFQPWSFYLGGKRTTIGLPNMPNYNLGALTGSECDTIPNRINEIQREKKIVSIYPNPANDELTIEVLNGIAPEQIEIVDAVGRVIMKLKQTKPTQFVNIKSFSSGIYFVKVIMSDGSFSVRKFVKE